MGIPLQSRSLASVDAQADRVSLNYAGAAEGVLADVRLVEAEAQEVLAHVGRSEAEEVLADVGLVEAEAAEVLASASRGRKDATSKSGTGGRARPGVRHSALPLLLAADAFALGVAVVCGQLLERAVNGVGSPARALESIIYVPVFLVVMACYGLYRRGRRRLVGSSFPDLGHLVHSLIVGSLLALVVAAGLHRSAGFPNIDRTDIAFTALFAIVSVTQARAVARWLGRRPQGRGSKVLIVGSGVVASAVVARLGKADGVRVVGCVDDNERMGNESWVDTPLLGGLDEIPSLVDRMEVDHIVVAFSPATCAKLAGLLRSLSTDVQISIVPRLFDLLTVRSHVNELYGLPVVDVAPPSFGPADRFAKRVMDVLASGFGLMLVSIPMIAIALAVKVTSPGPVLFKQERTGRGGRSFHIDKFRTMHVGAERDQAGLTNDVDGPLFKSHHDPRVTAVGRFLRKTSLDELPQLFNVLKGDMSLVGPRPFVTTESNGIGGWATRRFDVRPGMTGLWQVSGRNDLPFAELCRLDYSYVASWSLWWDIRILWHTPAVVFRRSGAY